MDWLRLYTEITRDRKLRRHPMAIRWIWIALMVMARRSPIPGTLLLSEGVPVTEEDIADEAAATLKDVRQAIDIFIEQKMIAKDDNIYYIVHWEKRQPNSDSSAERTRKYRESLKQKKTVTVNDSCPANETSLKRHNYEENRNVTEASQSCHSDVLDTDTETEADKDTEKDIYTTAATTRAREEVYKLFQQEIGVISPTMAENLILAIDDYSPEWVYHAIKRAAMQGKRNLAYVLGVLSGWKADGFDLKHKPWEERICNDNSRKPGTGKGSRENYGKNTAEIDWANEPDHL